MFGLIPPTNADSNVLSMALAVKKKFEEFLCVTNSTSTNAGLKLSVLIQNTVRHCAFLRWKKMKSD